MLSILFSIMLGSMHYTVARDCNELGHTYFPLVDSRENRILYICDKYPGQTKQIVEHELLHICMHDHLHSYTTPEELDKHLHQQTYSEEYVATIIAPCLIENHDKLFTALRRHGVEIQ